MLEPVIPDAKAGHLAMLVGAIVLYYAMIEHWIDGLVFCVRERADGAIGLRKQHPYTGKGELEHLRKCFEQLPTLSEFKADALALLAKIDKASEFRAHVVHGALDPVDWDTGEMRFTRTVKGENGQPHTRVLTIAAPELLAESKMIMGLIEPTKDLLYRLMAKLAPEYLREKPRNRA